MYFDGMKTMKTKNSQEAVTLDPDEKVRTNFLLRRATKERLARAKRRLNCSETACVEAALRLWFNQEDIE
jgi:hypothetical protein